MLEVALQYAKLGFHVLPVNGKRPLVAWQDHQTQAPSAEQITRWWQRWPEAGVAAITGRGMVVIDVDRSFESAEEARKTMGIAPTGMIARTPRGGFHFYYRHPGKVSNSVKTDIKMDIRGDGGIVVLPPSPGYSWVSRGKPGVFVPPEQIVTGGPRAKRQEMWVTELLQGVTKGGRNDAATKLAGYFIGKGMPQDIVLSLLHGWNQKNNPPIPDIELERTVQSVATRGGKSGAFSVVKFDDYLKKWAHLVQDWVIDDWLPDNTILMVTAKPGSYKTWVTVDLAVSVASGEDFLGLFAVKKPGPVLVVQQEDSHPGVASRLARVAWAKIPKEHRLPDDQSEDEFDIGTPPSLPIFIHEERSLRFEDKAIMERFEEAIAEYRPRVIVMDPLYSFLSTDEYMQKIGDHMIVLKMLRDKYGCSFVLVHHARKSSEGSSDRSDLWGSVFVDASREGGWSMAKLAVDTVGVSRHFKVGGEFPELPLKFTITDAGEYWVEIQDASSDEESVMEALNRLSKIDDVAVRTGLTTNRVRSILARLTQEGLVDKLPGNRYGKTEASIEVDV